MSKAAFKPEIKQPGTLTWPFRLGDEVKDTLTGITGVLISRFYHMSGCDQFGLELPAKDGALVAHEILSGERLELVTAHPERHREEVPDLHVKLGDKVKDIIGGMTGTAIIIMVPLHRAVQVAIQPAYNTKDQKNPEPAFVDAGFIEVTTPYTPRAAKEPSKAPTKAVAAERGSMRMPKGSVR